jgi:hypothetical protein
MPPELKRQYEAAKQAREVHMRIREANAVPVLRIVPCRPPIVLPEHMTGERIRKMKELNEGYEAYRHMHPGTTDVLFQYVCESEQLGLRK